MQLTEYPAAIEATACEAAQYEANVTHLRFELNSYELEADLNIAFDSELKNDHQRRARRAELLANDTRYSKAQQALTAAVQQRACTLARLEALRHELEILKPAPTGQPLDLAVNNHHHYLAATIAPEATYEWEQIQFKNPTTGEVFDLNRLIAGMIADRGQYLVELDVKVKVLAMANGQAD